VSRIRWSTDLVLLVVAGVALAAGGVCVAFGLPSFARVVWHWPVLVQAAFYLFMGIVWILPLKPLLRWIETGSFRARD